MRNAARKLIENRYSDSIKILIFLVSRTLLFISAIFAGVLLNEAGFHPLVLTMLLIPFFIVHFKYAPSINELIAQQKSFYQFRPSTDIDWNVKKHKEYEKIRKAEIKWWEFWL